MKVETRHDVHLLSIHVFPLSFPNENKGHVTILESSRSPKNQSGEHVGAITPLHGAWSLQSILRRRVDFELRVIFPWPDGGSTGRGGGGLGGLTPPPPLGLPT